MDETDNYFGRIERFVLSAQLLDETVWRLREEGQFRVESIVFWVGSVTGSTARVTRLVVPRGEGVFKHPFQVRVSENVIAAICDLLDPPQLVLLGQAHTHMHDAFHSPSDDRYSLDSVGYLSLVIPEFAKEDAAHWEEWAFFECEGSGSFRQLDAPEIHQRFVIDPGAPVGIHVVTG